MRKTLLLVVAMGLLMACGTKNNQQDNATRTAETNTESSSGKTLSETPVETPSEENPAAVEEVQPFFGVEPFVLQESKPLRNRDGGEESYEEVMAFKCDIDLPVTDSERLYDSICHWICGCVYYNYEGDPGNIKTMMELFKKQLLTVDDDEFQEGFDMEYTIKMLEANDKYVSYQCDLFYEAASDPRASFERRCATFDRSTGQRFGYPMMNKNEELESLVKKALVEQHFSDYDSKEMEDIVFFDPYDDEEDGFSLPIRDPWILHNSVCFTYGIKEVADYCAGMPECSLPYSIVEPYLTEKGKKYFQP